MTTITNSSVANLSFMDDSIPIGHYRFTLRANEPIKLPEFSGSILRGSFGWALKGLTCMTKLDDCEDCPLYSNCHYPALFNPRPSASLAERFPSIPAPYLFSPTLSSRVNIEIDEELTFDLMLFGKYAISQLPLIVIAWQRASNHGLGKGYSQAELLKVEHINRVQSEVIYTPGGKISPHQAEITLIPAINQLNSITLELTTPTRIQFENKIVGPEKLNASMFLIALKRKVMLYCACYLNLDIPATPFAAEIQFDCQLEKKDFIRYSNRQKQRMNLEGIVGTITLTGKLDALWPLLQLGQYTHVGKNTSFGLGQYKITHVNGLVFDNGIINQT